MSDAWPERIIDLDPRRKVGLSLADPDRYFRQCRAERQEEAREIVAQRLEEAAAVRRRPGRLSRLLRWRSS